MNLKSIQFLLISYIGIAFLGGCALSMPIMHKGHLDFFDAFFTAISAFTCTGLIIKDTGLDFSVYGQAIILLLIQIGGFGYMSMLALLYVIFRKQLSSQEVTMLKTVLNFTSYESLVGFIKRIAVFVLVFEAIGAFILTLVFHQHLGGLDSLKAGVFHSISAFNNAGFSIFSTGLAEYRNNFALNLTICILIIFGGLGFIVISELYIYLKTRAIIRMYPKSEAKKPRMSLHSKIVLTYTLLLILGGMFMILFYEWGNNETLGGFNPFSKVMQSFFLSVNYRTAGFATFDLGHLNEGSIFFSILFMIIGGAPGGTAAGMKVTTIAVVFAFCMSAFSNSTPHIFNRAIAPNTIRKAFVVFILTIICLFVAIFIISLLEPKLYFLNIFFEIASAFATVGLSTGDGGTLSLCALFSPISNVLMMFFMISGKIGILAFWLALFGQSKESRVKLITERIII